MAIDLYGICIVTDEVDILPRQIKANIQEQDASKNMRRNVI